MEKSNFRKITSRILRHGGFITKMNKETKEYELFEAEGDTTPTLYCLPVIEEEDGKLENYLCFRTEQQLNDNAQKLYDRLVKRFTRLAPSIIITFENELEPVFSDKQIEIIDQMLSDNNIEIKETNDEAK